MRGTRIALIAGVLLIGLASGVQAQTCTERFDTMRALVVAIATAPLNTASAQIGAALAALDAFRVANCIATTPPIGQVSPAGTRTPPAPSVTDAQMNVWTVGPQEATTVCGPAHPEWCHKILKNGVWVTGVYGAAVMLGWESPPVVYLQGDDGQYYYFPPSGVCCTYYGPMPPQAPTPPGGVLLKPAAVAFHDGLQPFPPAELWYDLFVDGQRVARQPKNNVWNAGSVWITIPVKSLASGDHTIQIAAVFLCTQGGPVCPYAERPSGQTLPPAMYTVP